MMTSGQIITNNDSYVPPSGGVNVDNVVRQLLLAGKTWKAYEEDMPSPCFLGSSSGNYARRHDPLSYYSDVMGSTVQCQNLVPFTQFAIDLANNQLPDYSFITPNLCNDAHNCSLTTADNWLKKNIAPLIASATFQDGLLVVLFDESGSDNTHGGGRVYWMAIGPKVKSGYQSTFSYYQHQSTERLSLEALGLKSFPGAGATAPSMAEFFSSSTPTISVSISPTSATIPSGGAKQFTASVTGATNTAVTWSASAGTVSTSGLYTAPTVSVNTSATVKVTSVADSTKSATASITITPPLTVAVTISPTSATVASGGAQQFTDTVTGTTNTVVTWSASAGTVSTSGLYTAPPVSVNTSATVKVTSVADSTKSATASITLTPPPPSPANPNFSLSVTPPSQTVVRGSTTKYTIKVTPSSGFSGSIAFAATRLSGGARASFSPASVTVSGTTSASSTMTIATGKGRTGTFTLTISASSRSITHSTTVSVTTTR